jgi:hypothetical protein
MADFNELIAVSFLGLETALFEALAKFFRDAMRLLLEELDEELFTKRDGQRYIVHEFKETCLETMLGPVRFRRRVYVDRQTGERVYGLDEALGLEQRARVSPGLRQVAVREAAEGVSYRGARDSIARMYGERMLSHETVRQLVLKAGKGIEDADRRLALEEAGERKVPVLFVEADGLFVSRQKLGKREERFAVAHEGWQRRSPGSGEYELVNKSYAHCGSAEDIWEEASRTFFSRYDLSETIVVINGDRAKWIRQGTEYFPKSIYQIDRFHLVREIETKLRLAPAQTRKDVLAAVRRNQPQEALSLMRAVRLADPKAQRELDELRRDLERYPEAMMDYRARLAEMGYDTTGMRGMGSAESIVNEFARRLRKQGRSWSRKGLTAIIRVLIKCYEGTLEPFTQWLDDIGERIDRELLSDGIGRIVSEVVAKATDVRGKTHRMPIRSAGRNASRGLSSLMNQLNWSPPFKLA